MHLTALWVLAFFAVSLMGTIFVSPASARWNFTNAWVSRPTTGGGTAGIGTVAVAAFGEASVGAGSFSGTLNTAVGFIDVEGVFSLNAASSIPVPVLPCGPQGEVGASGTIIFGSFQGQNVVVFGCVGASSLGGLQIIDRKSGSIILYEGTGIGDTVVSISPIVAGAVAAGNTSGAGLAGQGTVSVADILVTTADGSVLGGGAFNGISDLTGVWLTKHVFAVVPPSCTITESGVITGGPLLGQLVTTSVTLPTCPPTSRGPQPVTITFTIGSATNPIYAGHGSGLAVAIPNLIEA